MTDYPVQLSIDYSDSSNRLTAFFRILLAIPIVLILAAVAAGPRAATPALTSSARFWPPAGRWSSPLSY